MMAEECFYENDLVSLYLSELQKIDGIQGRHHQLALFKHPVLSKVLVLDGEIQHIENYSCLYHEMLVHLPGAFISEIKSALILGGGSLFAAYELLKYPTLENITLCDHEPAMLRLMEKHYDHARYVLNDARFHYHNVDGVDFLTESKEYYDLIINDCFNLALTSQSQTRSLFDMMHGLLTDDGICSDIVYRHIFDQQTINSTLQYLCKFCKLVFSLVVVPEYPGVLHLESIWGKNRYLKQTANTIQNAWQNTIFNSGGYEFYNPDYISFYLYLPPYIKKILNKELFSKA